MNPDNISAAAWDAISAQKADDDRAESVAAIFIDDALKANRLPNTAFSAVERMVDRRWKPKGGH